MIDGHLSGLSVAPSGRHFLAPDGSPFFALGDTQWDLLRCCTPDEAVEIAARRTALGYTLALVMLTGAPAIGPHGAEPEPQPDRAGLRPWRDGDPLHPEEAYFAQVDRVLRAVAGRGLVLVVGIYHKALDGQITLGNARAWARWVARRYRDIPDLVWCMYPPADQHWRPLCRELAAGLQEGDGGAHLITVHPDPMVASSSFLHDEPWLAFNMIQTCLRLDAVAEAVRHDYELVPPKPVFLAEGGYEGLEFGRLHTPLHMRQQAWWTWLAGGWVVYGHNDCWADPTAWRRWLDAPGAHHTARMRAIASAVPRWWERVPAAELLAAEGTPAAAHDSERRWLMAYASADATLRLTPLAASTAEVSAIDPANGGRLALGRHPVAAPLAVRLPAGWEDMVLLAEACDG